MHKGRFRFGLMDSRSHSVNRDASEPPNAVPVMITGLVDSSNCDTHI